MGYPYIKISALKWQQCPLLSGLVTCNGCGTKGVRVNWQESWFSPHIYTLYILQNFCIGVPYGVVPEVDIWPPFAR